jgi:hypothetical protein
MNKSELESILKKARLPEIAEESLEMFPRRIVARLKRNDPPPRPARNFPSLLAWAFGLAACLAIAFAIGHWRGRTEAAPSGDLLANARVVRETLAMFPNRLRAIVQDERGLSLILSESEDVPVSPPLYVRMCDGQHCSSFVTFSGQEIQVAGQKITVLADARGDIILTGNQFVWLNTRQIPAGKDMKIEAKNLAPAVM